MKNQKNKYDKLKHYRLDKNTIIHSILKDI